MTVTFQSLGISDERAAFLETLGFQQPTPIQVSAIPQLLAGRDVLGQAQTGTGKTAAFSLPILERIQPLRGEEALQALVLTPTRELAIQVAQAMRDFSQRSTLRILAVYGGSAIERQISQLQRGVHVIVGTPGRIMDLMDRGVLRLHRLSWFVLDEADEMLNMGFLPDVEKILAATPKEKQTAFFSATLPSAIRQLAGSYLHSPAIVRVESEVSAPARIRQQAYIVPSHLTKGEALLPILELENPTAAIVFVRTKGFATELTALLQAAGHDADEYHGNLSQSQRENLLHRFREQRVRLVVATDIAARGLDIDNISHVFNLDLPDDLDRYVHRIGRTGRAGREGKAIAFLSQRERYRIAHIERQTGQPLEICRLPTLSQLQAQRIERFTQSIREALGGERLASFFPLVSRLAEEYDPQAIAAAALQVAYTQARSERAEQTITNILNKQPDRKPVRDGRPVRRSSHGGNPNYGGNNGGNNEYGRRNAVPRRRDSASSAL